jgi:hypothetical protein
MVKDKSLYFSVEEDVGVGVVEILPLVGLVD